MSSEMKRTYLLSIIVCFILIFSTAARTNADDETCAALTGIWEDKEPKGESKLLEIHRKGKVYAARVGMELFKNDRIQAKDPRVGFAIRRYAIGKKGERIVKDNFVLDSPENRPYHLIIKECGKETWLEGLMKIIAILKSGWPFKIKTESAIAGAPGTTFTFKQLENGRVTKLMVTKGEAYLKNEYGSITIRESEEGTAIKGRPPTKSKVAKNYIEKELRWAFKRKDLPLMYAQEFNKYWVVKEAGVKDDVILIGTTTSETGPFAYWGTGINIGSQAHFNYINEKGGIHGRRLVNIVYDDAYNPTWAVKNAKRLIFEDKVFCLFSPYGTATSLEMMPIMKEYKIPLFSPITLSPTVVRPFNPYVFALYPDLFTQAENIVNYVASMKKFTIATIYVNDEYGKASLEGTKAALWKKDLKLVSKVSIRGGESDLGYLVPKLRSINPDAVILFTNPIQAATFIRQSRHWKPLFIVPSPIPYDQLIRIAGPAAEGVVVPSILPDPKTSLRHEVIQYRHLLQKYFPAHEHSNASLLGYTSAKVFTEGLKRIGRTLTRDLFIKSLETMKGYKTGLIHPVTFDQNSHLGTKCLYYNKVVDGKFAEFELPCR